MYDMSELAKIKVIIGGDVCPRGPDVEYFQAGNAQAVFHDLLEEFQGADLTVVNLECPLTDQNHPIPKRGPALKAPPACAGTFKNANVHVLNLANNHILDHGAPGLRSTLETAALVGLDTVGSGQNLAEARRILVKVVGGLRIGILGMAEHEFSIATATSYGANPLDIIDFTRNVAAEREKLDYLIVLLHGGIEHYPLPSPRLKETCRFFIEQGANAVICQHSHCVGCYEEYLGGHIVYGQGNLVFQGNDYSRAWTEGVLVRLSIAGPGNAKMELVPYVQSRSRGVVGVAKMQAAEAQSLLQEIEQRSACIPNDAYLHEQWERFCSERKNEYLSVVLGHNRILSRLNKNGLVVKWLYSVHALLGIENHISCEAHREVLETIFSFKGSNR